MAILTRYSHVADGDQLNNGLFNDNWDTNLVLSGMAQIESLRSLNDASLTTRGINQGILRDYFIDADGINDSVNTDVSATTAPYTLSTESYGAIVDGDTASFTHPGGSGSTVSSITTSCTAAVEMIITQVKVASAGGSGTMDIDVEIKDSGATTLATKSATIALNGNNTFTFVEGDYSSNIPAGSFSIVITKTAGTGVLQEDTGNTLASSIFSFTSQGVGTLTGGASATDWIIGEATTTTATMVETNALFNDVLGTTTQAYGAPASTTTGALHSFTCTANEDMILTRLTARLSSGSGAKSCTIKSGSDTLATTVSISATVNQEWLFELSDYSRPLIAGETIDIEFGANLHTVTGQSTSGTLFDITSQEVPGDNSGYDAVIEATELGGSDIESIGVVCDKTDNETNPITYDVSSDNGSTFTTGLSLNRKNDITSTVGKVVILRFQIPADDTVELHGYCAKIKE